MRQIKSFAVLQTSKVMGAVYFLFGLLVMVPLFLYSCRPREATATEACFSWC